MRETIVSSSNSVYCLALAAERTAAAGVVARKLRYRAWSLATARGASAGDSAGRASTCSGQACNCIEARSKCNWSRLRRSWHGDDTLRHGWRLYRGAACINVTCAPCCLDCTSSAPPSCGGGRDVNPQRHPAAARGASGRDSAGRGTDTAQCVTGGDCIDRVVGHIVCLFTARADH